METLEKKMPRVEHGAEAKEAAIINIPHEVPKTFLGPMDFVICEPYHRITGDGISAGILYSLVFRSAHFCCKDSDGIERGSVTFWRSVNDICFDCHGILAPKATRKYLHAIRELGYIELEPYAKHGYSITINLKLIVKDMEKYGLSMPPYGKAKLNLHNQYAESLSSSDTDSTSADDTTTTVDLTSTTEATTRENGANSYREIVGKYTDMLVSAGIEVRAATDSVKRSFRLYQKSFNNIENCKVTPEIYTQIDDLMSKYFANEIPRMARHKELTKEIDSVMSDMSACKTECKNIVGEHIDEAFSLPFYKLVQRYGYELAHDICGVTDRRSDCVDFLQKEVKQFIPILIGPQTEESDKYKRNTVRMISNTRKCGYKSTDLAECEVYDAIRQIEVILSSELEGCIWSDTIAEKIAQIARKAYLLRHIEELERQVAGLSLQLDAVK